MELSNVQLLGLLSFTFFTCYRCSSIFKFYTKFFIYYLSGIIWAAVCLPIFFAWNGKSVLNFLIYTRTYKHLTKLLGIKWTLRGAEHLGQNKSLIVVANHQTSLDILGMFNVWHTCKLMTVLAKKTLLYVPFFGQSAYLADIIFIDRHSSTAKETMNKAMKRLKEKNIKLWVFPEGTRRNTGAIHEFKKGAFHTAIEEELPIVPVVFSSYQHFLDTTRKSFDEGEIIITALPEISTKGMTFRDLDKLIEQVKSDMTEVYNRTSRETLQKSLK